jgi:hypothetical protein
MKSVLYIALAGTPRLYYTYRVNKKTESAFLERGNTIFWNCLNSDTFACFVVYAPLGPL